MASSRIPEYIDMIFLIEVLSLTKIFQRISKVMEIPLYHGYPLRYPKGISEGIMERAFLCNIFLKSKTAENELL